MANELIGTHNLCTVTRIKQVKSYSLNIVSGERSDPTEYVVTEACGVPLFGDEERRTGVCRSCHQGWDMEGNTYATPAEKERAMKALSPERIEYLSDIITMAVEGGINYWADVSDYHWELEVLGAERNHAEASIRDHNIIDRQDKWHPLTPTEVDFAVERIRKGPIAGLAESVRRHIVLANAVLDACALDGELADIIVQVYIYGEVVYG